MVLIEKEVVNNRNVQEILRALYLPLNTHFGSSEEYIQAWRNYLFAFVKAIEVICCSAENDRWISMKFLSIYPFRIRTENLLQDRTPFCGEPQPWGHAGVKPHIQPQDRVFSTIHRPDKHRENYAMAHHSFICN